ncbi:hypothetical protein J6590_020310 [Homalodisca vitripennis]|nr:hypothetical protein J6590_020310 [Homalodisca vitripennis]
MSVICAVTGAPRPLTLQCLPGYLPDKSIPGGTNDPGRDPGRREGRPLPAGRACTAPDIRNSTNKNPCRPTPIKRFLGKGCKLKARKEPFNAEVTTCIVNSLLLGKFFVVWLTAFPPRPFRRDVHPSDSRPSTGDRLIYDTRRPVTPLHSGPNRRKSKKLSTITRAGHRVSRGTADQYNVSERTREVHYCDERLIVGVHFRYRCHIRRQL